MSDSKILVEKWSKVLSVSNDKVKTVPSSLQESTAQLLENQQNWLNEESMAADMAQFTPILIPAVRRIFPQLLAHEIVGVQTLNGPTGYAYALRYSYAGNEADPVTGMTELDSSRRFASVAVIFNDGTTLAKGAVIKNSSGTTVGTVAYTEENRALVKLATMDTVILPGTYTVGTDDITISYVMNNEAGYNLIFKNYSGWYTTAVGETKGTAGNEMNSMKMSLERKSVEVQTSKLKAEYTIELAQDLKNVHGLDAEAELINILDYEITAEKDRRLVDQINAVATVSTPWVYGAVGDASGTADGRWEQEKFRTLYTKIIKEANQIAITTRRGAGNFIIGSINAVTALEGLSSFMYSAVPGQVQAGIGIVKVGTLDGRFSVYIDTFAFTDYITVGYKGQSQFDTGVVYCPYIPLMMQKVVDPKTFQPKIGFMERSATMTNLYGANNYYRRFACDFTGSTLQGSYF